MIVFPVCDFDLSILAKKLAGKRISEVTYVVSNGTLNFSSCQSVGLSVHDGHLLLFKLIDICNTEQDCLVELRYGADVADGYDPSLMMDGSPDLYDERLMYNGGAGAGRYVHPAMAARLVLFTTFLSALCDFL